MSYRPQFGLIGAGAIGKTYVQAFAASEEATLVAVADVELDFAEAAAAEVNGRGFPCYRAMAEQIELDAVVICTPPVTHPDIACYFLQRGVHVLCEKPLSIDVKSAHRMRAVARESGSMLTMASKFRYVQDVARAKELVESGYVGEVVLFENAFTSRVDMSRRWNSRPEVSGGGVLIDNGTHSVDITRYFLGPLTDITVVEGKRVQGLEVEDTARIFVRNNSGVLGSIDLSWTINKELSTYLNIYGSEGTICLGWKESKCRRLDDAEWTVFGKGYDKVQAFRSQIDNFARAIRGEESLVITADDAVASVEVIHAAYQALNSPQWTLVLNGVGQTETDELASLAAEPA